MNRKKDFEKPKDSKKTLRRVWQYLSKYKYKLLLVVLCIVLYIAFNTAASLLLTPIIDDYIIPLIKDPSNVIYLNGLKTNIILLIACVISAAAISYCQYRVMIIVAQSTVKDMRKDLFDKLEELPIKFYDTHVHGELMSRITNDLDNVSIALDSSIDQIISGVLTVLVNLVVMFVISPTLALISIVTLPLLSFVSIKIAKLTKKQFIKQQQAMGDLNGYIEEYISGQKVIKAFNQEENIKHNFKKYNNKLRQEGFKAQAYSAMIMPIMGSINNISLAIICIVSGSLAIKGRISIGKIATFYKFARQFSQPITEVGQQFSVIQSGLAGAERMFEIIDEESEFTDSLTKQKLSNVKGLVEFKNVSFAYDKDLVLKNVNLTVQPGEKVALVGPTGAGKTTIINLLTRFYDTTEGDIYIDGKNIKDMNIYSLRDTLGIVLQDTALFSETVKNNIKFGKLNASNEEIEKASKLANADSFIRRLPNGYDTYLNENTTNISVGQQQLLNIARVVLNNPKILVLDEATSNVDTRTEVKIGEAMDKLMKGRTSFVIAHRLSTIRDADHILVVNNGEIVEHGNHDELIKKKGIYFDMYTGLFSDK